MTSSRTTTASTRKPPDARRFLLGIDTSCDDTSVALLDNNDGRVVVNLVSSQIQLHAGYGGVVPELASRAHVENLAPLFKSALTRAVITTADIAGVAVTNRPGLIGCLLVGVSFARALAYRLQVPLFAINHLEAHLFSPFIGSAPVFPFLGLVVSGGHTAFYRVTAWDGIELIGQTVDDAAGEAYDKVAKLMGLGYPGGPLVDKLARAGDERVFAFTIPKVKMGKQYLSFSGIKTALAHHWQKTNDHGEKTVRDLCAGFQRVVADSLTAKARGFLISGDYAAFAVSGGVAMNSLLREESARLCAQTGVTLALAAPEYCSDNAAMVACLARHRHPLASPLEMETKATTHIEARALKMR